MIFEFKDGHELIIKTLTTYEYSFDCKRKSWGARIKKIYEWALELYH